MDSQQWDDLADVVEFEPDKVVSQEVYRFLQPRVEHRGLTLSDLGPGAGSLTAKLSPLFSKVIGIDFSKRMLDRFTREVTAYGCTNFETCLADLRTYVPDKKTDIAMACACPVFYRTGDAPKLELFASGACVLVMPTIHESSMIRKVLVEAGLDVHIGIDAELVERDRSLYHKVESKSFLEKREKFTPLVMKSRCLHYTDGSAESEAAIKDVIDGMDESELYSDRWMKIVYWELD